MAMTLEELETIRYLDSEITAVQREIEGLYNTYHSPALNKTGSAPQHPGDPTAQTVQKIIALQKKYNTMLTQMADHRDQINIWLCGLSDPEIKSIIRWHYMCGKSWKQTSGLIYGLNGYDFNARKVVMRYFGKEK